MQRYFLFLLLTSVFSIACSNTENTKTKATGVNNDTSQPIVTTEKPSDTTPPEDEQSDTPNDPLTPSGEAVVTTPPTADATSPRPSPERTNVSPAKVAASKTTVPSAPQNSANPPTRSESGAAATTDSPVTVTEKSEEKGKTTAPSPISSDESKTDTKPQNPPPFSHQAWDDLLKKYVTSSGRVNYAGIKKDLSKLNGYLQDLQNNPPQNDWPKNKAMAYWINAYNTFTVKLIVDNYPVASITKLEGGKPWDKKWIKIGDKTYSLNNIENDILRPKYKDARIHFAVNCAAKSCPPLLNQAWTADNLNNNFEKQAKSFINNPSFNKISDSKIQVSKIFEWYASDFGNLIEFLNKYAATKIDGKAKVEYLEYNWDLNE